ncbi:MAG TPA: hypothetical protein VGG86_13300, partial [Roseiarcus sp.]
MDFAKERGPVEIAQSSWLCAPDRVAMLAMSKRYWRRLPHASYAMASIRRALLISQSDNLREAPAKAFEQKRMSRIFLSHSSKESFEAIALKNWLA